MSDSAFKIRENRARRAAERRGLMLEKSRRRDPGALDFGTYQLVDARTRRIMLGAPAIRGGYGTATIDEVEAYLQRPRKKGQQRQRTVAQKFDDALAAAKAGTPPPGTQKFNDALAAAKARKKGQQR